MELIKRYAPFLIFLFLCLTIFGASYLIQGNYLLNGNISWLLIAAERMLDGQSMAEHIYETNPPLSILIYTPHVAFSQLIGIPIADGFTYLTYALVVVSIITTHFLLRSLPFLTTQQRYAFTLTYLATLTLTTNVFFGEREHILIMALVPFVLCQYALLEQLKIPKTLSGFIFVVGALCVLIKPHYGLIPTTLILARLVKQRSVIQPIFKGDFIALALCTVGYLACIYFFFYDYLTIIFPKVLDLYLGMRFMGDTLNSVQMYLIMAIGYLVLESTQSDLKDNKKTFLYTLCVCSILCFVPYFVQMKGFFNHIIPIITFLYLTLAMAIVFRIPKLPEHLRAFTCVIPVILILSLANSLTPLMSKFPKKSDVPDLPLSVFLEKECPKPCTFFAFHRNIEIINPTALIMDYTHGTRFPSFWFLPKLLNNDKLSEEERSTLKQTFTQYVADDLEHYKPSVLLIYHDMDVYDADIFTFVPYFKSNDDFKDIIENDYVQTGTFEFDRGAYFKGTSMSGEFPLKYLVFKRKDTL